MKFNYYLIAFFLLVGLLPGCEQKPNTVLPAWEPYDETAELAANAEHQSMRMRYKLIQSKVSDRNVMLQSIENQLGSFGEDDYRALYALVYEKSIEELQTSVEKGELSYEKLVKWYLYRIASYENNRDTYTNAIIAVNPQAVATARERDRQHQGGEHPIYGMPVLLKDNINFEGLPTTAGAHALLTNYASDAPIVTNIKAHGGIILGKTSLSEWANYLCSGCPNGYSAVGGQTLNPYGRKVHDTGGSSSGTGAAMAANYAAAGVGTETSGSILSPSSANSLVGLKPTVGVLSRGGIVPISGTYDTPGPMTRTVADNAILLDAMTGEADPLDAATADAPHDINYLASLAGLDLTSLRIGVNKVFLTDSVFKSTLETLAAMGATLVEFDPVEIKFEGFGRVLNGDMYNDLPHYLKQYGAKELPVASVEDVVVYNRADSAVRIPYGQARFAGILTDHPAGDELDSLKDVLMTSARSYFDGPMDELALDVILSVNNRGAGYAATALYPCLTVPMGYRENGKPMGMTFIAPSFSEDFLLRVAVAFEKATHARKPPVQFANE